MTSVRTQPPSTSAVASSELRPDALGFPALLAQSIALISPTMTAVLIIPLAFSNAGQGTWLAYLFGTAMLLFVVFNLNQFARRSTSPGSMYAYTGRGLGAVGGVLSGWTLIWSYLFIGVAGMTGFTIFSRQFLDIVGIHTSIPAFVFFAISAVCLLDVGGEGHPAVLHADAHPRGTFGTVHPGARRNRALQARNRH